MLDGRFIGLVSKLAEYVPPRKIVEINVTFGRMNAT